MSGCTVNLTSNDRPISSHRLFFENMSLMHEDMCTPGSFFFFFFFFCRPLTLLVFCHRLSQEAKDVLSNFYVKLRSEHTETTPITSRQLESLIRLAEARAKLELREVVTGQDALVCFFLFIAFLNNSLCFLFLLLALVSGCG
jgi:hypothetical protein